MENTKYKLSPSDFAYLYEECKCCYYLKIKYGIQRPSLPFPAIFGAINTRIQGTLIGKNLQELSPNLPEGLVESQEKFVESKVIPGTKLYIKGKYDLLVKQADGTYIVVDFKITSPNDDKIAKYQTQLQAYHYAFEFSEKGESKEVSKLGLIVVYPDRVKFAKGEAFLSFPPKWFEVELKKESFLKFMKEVNDLLEGPTPKENADCKWCEFRHYGEKYAHLFSSN